MLQVPEQYAGQQMRCPLCNNLFTVPGLPETPALAPPPPPPPPPVPPPVPPPPQPAPYSLANEPPPPPPLPPLTFEPEKPAGSTAPVPPLPRPTPPPPPVVGDYTKLRSITISPQVVPWIGPIALFVLFLLTFFPWVGEGIVSYNPWSLGFGDGDATKIGGALFIVYDLLLIFGMLTGLASLLMYAGVIPPSPQLKGIEPWRGVIVGAFTWIAFLLLFISVLINLFRLNAIWLNFWGWLAYDVHFVASAALLLQMWLELRGPSRPPPRIDIHT